MDNLMIMQITKGINQLINIILCLWYCEFFTTFKHLKHILIVLNKYHTPLEHIYNNIYTFY